MIHHPIPPPRPYDHKICRAETLLPRKPKKFGLNLNHRKHPAWVHQCMRWQLFCPELQGSSESGENSINSSPTTDSQPYRMSIPHGAWGKLPKLPQTSVTQHAVYSLQICHALSGHPITSRLKNRNWVLKQHVARLFFVPGVPESLYILYFFHCHLVTLHLDKYIIMCVVCVWLCLREMVLVSYKFYPVTGILCDLLEICVLF